MSEIAEALDAIKKFHKTLPAYSDVLTEEDGSVWLRGYSLRLSTADQSWTKFDSAGLMVGTLSFEDRLIRFSNGHAIVRHKDDESGFTAVSVFGVEPVVR